MGARARLNLAQKQAIIAQHLLGLTYPQIAKKCSVGERSVQRVVQDFKANSAKEARESLEQELTSWKDQLKQLSIKTLRLALDDKSPDYELYKAAPIATVVMKGIGEFQEVSLVGVQVALAEPASWRSTYRSPAKEVMPVDTNSSKLCKRDSHDLSGHESNVPLLLDSTDKQ